MQAVAYDFYHLSKTFGPGEEVWGGAVGWPFFLFSGLLSLPFDLFGDIIVLPIDVGAWIAGRSKRWPERL